MPDRNFSDHQKKIIRRYYDNREQQDEQRLAELVTNLYLAEGKKRDKMWESAREMMTRIGVPKSRVEHVMKTADAAILAEVVKDLQSGAIRLVPPKPEGEAAK
jgi:alcohol dehydrogenase class IV